MVHRGPDDAGLWSSHDGKVILGSRRLAILDLSARGHQPMQDASGNLTIVFNGEIYNFMELREDLSKNYHFCSSSDTEVLLAAYDRWGTNCLYRLNGMFAFAIWDRNRRQLFAARDRFGEKPFYYIRDPRLFLFASEIKALFASGLVDPQPNPAAIYRYLAYRETDAHQETLFKNVLSLPPAQALLYSLPEGALKIWQYWDLDPDTEIRLPSDQAYAEQLLELLKDSVKIRLRSDVPVGSSLSGGIDSSTIVGLLSSQVNGNRQATFSARFHDPRLDEGHYIQCVVKRFPIESHCVYPDPVRLLVDMEKFAWHQEHPFSNPTTYAQWCVMRLAKEQGVTVLLDGQGGDESLAGYGNFYGSYYKDLLRQFRWGTFLAALGEHIRLVDTSSLTAALAPLLPSAVRQPLKQIHEPLAIRPEFNREWKAPPTLLRSKYRSFLHDDLYQHLRCSMLPKLLRFADRSSMAFSREVRLPLLDHRVVEYLFAIPEDQKIRGAITKVVLRRAMTGLIPDKILRRTDKRGFEPPQAAWLQGPLRGWADDMLHSPEFCQREWVDANRAQLIWNQFLSGQRKCHNLIFRWLSLEIWARIFLKQPRFFQRPPSAEETHAGTCGDLRANQ